MKKLPIDLELDLILTSFDLLSKVDEQTLTITQEHMHMLQYI